MRYRLYKRIIAFMLVLSVAFSFSTNSIATDGALLTPAETTTESPLLTPIDSVAGAGTTTEVTTTEATTTEAATTEKPEYEIIDDVTNPEKILIFEVQNYMADQVTIRWSVNKRTATGYFVYRKDNYNTKMQLIASGSPSANNLATRYTDDLLVPGVTYSYYVQPYYKQSDGSIKRSAISGELKYTREFTAPVLDTATRTNKKVKLKWTAATTGNGFLIYRAKGKGSYSKVKKVKNGSATSATVTGNALKSTYKYKMRAYVFYEGQYIYSDYSGVAFVDTKKNSTITGKFKKLKKKYPSGYYWNHMGVSNYDSTTITTTPCNHSRFGYTYCNLYKCPTGKWGVQCYGFAWKMSDLIYGKKTKYTKHKKFSKAKVGDVIRYSGHSVIITEKHADYIVVGECNIGGTCVIRWGRHIYKSELSGATYFHRKL